MGDNKPMHPPATLLKVSVELLNNKTSCKLLRAVQARKTVQKTGLKARELNAIIRKEPELELKLVPGSRNKSLSSLTLGPFLGLCTL